MTFNKQILLLLPLFLAACAHAPQPAAPVVNVHEGMAAEPAAEQLVLPNVPLDAQTLYEFLLGDVANQRGAGNLAAQAYYDLADRTRDPRVARRAAQLAFEAREADLSLKSFRLWQELEPASPLARQMLAMMLLTEGQLTEAKPLVEAMLAAEPNKAGAIFLQVRNWLARAPNKNSAVDFLIELTQPYPKVAEGHLAVAQSALAAKRGALAASEAHEAVRLLPDWDTAVVFEVQVLLPIEPDKALSLTKKYLDGHSENNEVRLFYARALLEQKHYAESRNEFQSLLKNHPDNADLAFAIALISLQLGELDRAENELKQTLATGKKDESTIYYYLAQLNEAKKDEPAALAQYGKVTSGEYVYASRLRQVYLLNKAGKLNEAREVLHQLEAPDSQQQVSLTLIEAQMLREARQYGEAYDLLSHSLEKQPNQPALLYEAAMAADKLSKMQDFEKLLRKLLQVAPDNAQAYNALGYSFLERKVRLEEGMKLVEKAYQLAPDDAAITDSVGWGNFLLGNMNKSIEFLRRAFAANPDPEIAAHLGEVLWAQGGKDEARKIWQDSLKSNPDSEVLHDVIKRFVH